MRAGARFSRDKRKDVPSAVALDRPHFSVLALAESSLVSVHRLSQHLWGTVEEREMQTVTTQSLTSFNPAQFKSTQFKSNVSHSTKD